MSTISLRSTLRRCHGFPSEFSLRRDLFQDDRNLSLRRTLRALSGRRIRLGRWLGDHWRIGNRLVWEDVNGPRRYWDWTFAEKADLQRAFDAVASCRDLRLSDPPRNRIRIGDGDKPVSVLSHRDAWALFTGYVAQSLVTEIYGWVRWSLLRFSNQGLDQLFNSGKMFNQSGNHYYIVNYPFGTALPAPPQFCFRFLARENLIAHTPIGTIVRTLRWCGENLVHIAGRLSGRSMSEYWQHRGMPPVSRMIGGTHYSGPEASRREDRLSWTAGCHGSTGFLRSVLRVVNIPVANEESRPVGGFRGHALPHFVEQRRYLSHGDDPYSRFMISGEIPYERLLVDRPTFNRWFRNPDPAVHNVGRRVTELALEFLPRQLLVNRCTELNPGRPRDVTQNDAVFQSLRGYLTREELRRMHLWQRLDEKIASLGGCPISLQPDGDAP